ncbi:MAG: YbaN family protein [Romboutsia timonensis]|uniref:YbaN family protein n=1 Tax=Romboutsia timonensis TaxID=1776391 RepID=UPI002A75597C|nr:YbaN family protein [Romboutsia timonensis]MDY2883342.1 YbaN family protein [Romboutsia timonensis]
MNRIKKIIFVIVGFISLLLGIIGTVLPILPTVPFLLLTSYCFARGSNKFEVWFKSSKIYKKYLENFILNKSMTLKQKIYISTFADIMIAFPLIILDNLYIKLFLIIIIIFKYYYFIFKIKTIKV